MNAEELRKLLHTVPFQPFTVYLPSEKAFEVPHPDFAMLTPNGRILVVSESEGDAVDILDVPLIARVHVNGQSKNR